MPTDDPHPWPNPTARFAGADLANAWNQPRGDRSDELAHQFRPAKNPRRRQKRRSPDNLWKKCPACDQMLFHRELEANLHVCRNCGHHLRIGAAAPAEDPVRRRRRRPHRAAASRRRSAALSRPPSATRTGSRRRRPRTAPAAMRWSSRMDGSAASRPWSPRSNSASWAARWGWRPAKRMLAAARLAVLQEAALIVVPASGGARMQEGVLSLMQMPRTIIAADMVKEAGLALYRAADRSDDRRRLGLVRDGRRHHPGRARCRHRLCRRQGHRRDDPREAAGGLSARRIPARARHGRHGRAARANCARRSGGCSGCCATAQAPERQRQRDRERHDRRGQRHRAGAADAAAPEADRSVAGPNRAAARRTRRSAGSAAAGRSMSPAPTARDRRWRRCAPVSKPAGWRVHAYTSPHLVRFHERIRLAGDADRRGPRCSPCSRNASAPTRGRRSPISKSPRRRRCSPSPAPRPTSCCSKPGSAAGSTRPMSIRHPAVTAITPISLDHQAFLGDTIAAIAGEKAGILKPGAPAVIGPQPPEAAAVFAARAAALGAPLFRFGQEWRCAANADGMHYDGPRWRLDLPLPSLCGAHQISNAGTAIACLEQLADSAGRGTGDRRRSAPYRLAGAVAAADAGRAGRRYCRRAGNCGSTAATIPAPARSWPRRRQAGAIGRSTSSSACSAARMQRASWRRSPGMPRPCARSRSRARRTRSRLERLPPPRARSGCRRRLPNRFLPRCGTSQDLAKPAAS